MVGELLDALVCELETAVPSYLGLQLTIDERGSPVVLTAFDDDHDGNGVTSLRVPLDLLDSSFATGSRIVFYARAPGAFVDLAADLTFQLRGLCTADLMDGSAPPLIRLDEDPPPAYRGFRLSGLTELSAINRAVGVLIGQGHHPDHVDAMVRSEASRAGLEPHAWAAQFLTRITT